MKKRVFRSAVDWWMWMLVISTLSIVWAANIGIHGWATIILPAGMTLMYAVLLFGCRYEVAGDTLTVYHYFRPHRYPVSKITEIGRFRSYRTAPALSSARIYVKFNSRSVMRSSFPLEVSPADRAGFIECLKEANPEISVRNR
ncbi:MAG: hypothetical protein HDS15_02905 [Bacteroides sp.]|nr:hypothetical protein [Bacteroides sp.]MDE7471597.1 PH domain-containing protein [Paramuribaculum sp.]